MTTTVRSSVEAMMRLFITAKRRPTAERIAARFLKMAGVVSQRAEWLPYEKIGGWRGTFRWNIDRHERDWSTIVCDSIATAQQIGHGWTITGSIDQGLELSTNKPRGAGVTMITFEVTRRIPT
jgi:hypothetical protein